MTPERHEQIAKLYHSALKLVPGERAAFLETACADDLLLRKEVESLLALDEQAEHFIESPAVVVAAELLTEESARLPIGHTVGFYRILSPLGAGGMGEVYLAEDTRLGRKIALKLLPVRFTKDADRLRWFEKEAHAASALNHPNIITIHDIGQIEGRHFIATEFINGQTLRQKILQQPMKLEEAIDITIQAANALAAAHEAGVVHRDIKPENIMLRTDGYVKVLDFGLAKLIQPTGVDPEGTTFAKSLTETGTVMGTARYMSPEQARGQRVDERSDIFSLGVVLYEMVAGQSPFSGATTADVIAAILGKDPSLTRVMPAVPEALERIVNKALRKDREERYQTVRAMISDLVALKKHDLETEPRRARKAPNEKQLIGVTKRYKRISILVAALVLLIAAGIAYLSVPDDAIDSIAVLPFVNESKNPDTEYLSDGISDSLITRLSNFPNLRVTSLSAALAYKGKSITPQDVGQELKVRAVLNGWLTLRGDVLSVRAELVDVRDNGRLWKQQYNNRRLSELLQVQDEISRDISSQLRLRLTAAQMQPLLKRETESGEAYLLYLLGRSQWAKLSEEGLRRSIEYFSQAVEKDPKYDLAYSGLADSYSLLGEASYTRPRETFSKAREYAERALELNPLVDETWVSLGIVKLLYDWDWPGAERALKRAKELNPNNPHAYHFYGHYLEIVGRTEEAIAETKRGLGLDPTSSYLNAELAWAYFWARQYDPALVQLRKALDLDPASAFVSVSIAQVYEQQHRYQDALDVLNKVSAPSSDWSWIVAETGCVYASMGNRTEAEKIISTLKQRAKTEWIDPVLIAYIYIALGNKDEAFRWLDEALRERSGLLPWLKIELKFDPLRSDPRFTRVLESVGLPL